MDYIYYVRISLHYSVINNQATVYKDINVEDLVTNLENEAIVKIFGS